MSTDREAQDEAARTFLSAQTDKDGKGFAVAGSTAGRLHGVIDRPTRDIDLFGDSALSSARFDESADKGTKALEEAGWTVKESVRRPGFRRVVATKGDKQVNIDIGIDWRKDEPVESSVGPVISVEDAAASKAGALYGRFLARDLIDIDSILRRTSCTKEQLFRLAKDRDPGVVPEYMVHSLRDVADCPDEDFLEYGIGREDLERIRALARTWADEIEEAGEAYGTRRNARAAPSGVPRSSSGKQPRDARGRFMSPHMKGVSSGIDIRPET